MAGKTLTKLDLSESIFHKVGLSKRESVMLLDSMLGHISDALVAGETVKLSSFATFTVRQKSARMGRNPKTGVAAHITPRRVLSFRPSQKMKMRVQKSKKA